MSLRVNTKTVVWFFNIKIQREKQGVLGIHF